MRLTIQGLPCGDTICRLRRIIPTKMMPCGRQHEQRDDHRLRGQMHVEQMPSLLSEKRTRCQVPVVLAVVQVCSNVLPKVIQKARTPVATEVVFRACCLNCGNPDVGESSYRVLGYHVHATRCEHTAVMPTTVTTECLRRPVQFAQTPMT